MVQSAPTGVYDRDSLRATAQTFARDEMTIEELAWGDSPIFSVISQGGFFAVIAKSLFA